MTCWAGGGRKALAAVIGLLGVVALASPAMASPAMASPAMVNPVAAGAAVASPAVAGSSPGRTGSEPPAQAVTAAATQAAPPLGEFADTLRFTVTAISPTVVTASGPGVLTIRGRLTNTGDVPLDNLDYKFQRGEAVTDVAAVDQALTDPGQPIAVIQPTFTPLVAHLDAHATTTFGATVPIGGTADTGLAITRPGVYPLMLNVNGELDGQGRARIGELHLLVTVLGLPGTAAPADGGAGAGPDGMTGVVTTSSGAGVTSGAGVSTGSGTSTTTLGQLPVGLFWPISDTRHLGVGGVFLNEDLAASIGPKGRLTVLLDRLTKLTSPRSFTVVIDPALLDELDRMARGYRVTATPGIPQPPLQAPSGGESATTSSAPSTAPASASATSAPGPASTTDPNATDSQPGTDGVSLAPTAASGSMAPATSGSVAPATSGSAQVADPDANTDTVPGIGSATAAAYLDRLRAELPRHRVVVLPYGDPDAVALVRQGMTAALRASIRSGAEVAARVLAGIPHETMVAVPPGGALDDATAATLKRDGYATAVLAGSSVSAAEPAGAVRITVRQPTTDLVLPAVVADSTVTSTVHDLVTGARGASVAARINALAAQLGQRALDGVLDPIAYLTRTTTAPNAAGTRAVADLLNTMAGAGAVTEIDPRATAESATVDGTLQYPVSPADELPSDYLGRWRAADVAIAGMHGTLRQAGVADSPDPSALTGELAAATANLGSAALRSDQEPGNLVLATVESTLQGLRDQVTIRSTAGSYTLTSGSSPLVLTLKNDLPYVVRVRIELAGAARAGLTVEDPGVIEVAARRTQQVRLPATVTRAGTFTVSARLLGADGTVWGQPVQLTIRSTAYGALTVVLIAVAGGVLLLMVVIRIVQRVRGRRRPEPPGDGGPAPDSITAAANDPAGPS